MAQVHGVLNRQKYYWGGESWSEYPHHAVELPIPEAHRQVRIINANNRFLDADERMDAEVVESR